MDCASCRTPNRPGAGFCFRCGARLELFCADCGAGQQPGARFCDSCGAALIVPGGPFAGTERETRRVVTLVFADLIGSTTLHERIDAESARRVMAGYYAALRSVVEDHDGTVIKLLGDGVLAGFGVQRAQEDDARRAVHAAVAMHGAMADLRTDQTGRLGLRVGVNTGEVVVSDGDDDVVGDPVNVAARLQQEAQDGEVLIGDSTRRLVDDLVTLEAAGEFSLKGRTGAVTAHRVVSLESPTVAPATSFVGRDDELRRILAVQSRTAVGRTTKLAVVVGSPGLGKSRLMDEVARRLAGEATILTARCEPDGGPTFTPVADALRALVSTELEEQAAGYLRMRFEELVVEDEPERDRIVDGALALCAGEPGPPEETFWVVRRILGAMGRHRPVVLALDDLHWAEPLLLDLIEHLVEWSSAVPLFVLGAARPELRETRSSLTTRGEMADEVIALDGLDAGAATRLAADAIGASELPAAVAGRVLAASEGNPLFLGALVRMLVDDGALQWDGDRWVATVELDDIDMPPTIHALLAARIDRLEPSMRLVLERASVIGRQFTRGAVMHLLPVELHAELDVTLDALRRSELVEPDAGWFLGEPSIRFHHALIRDAAYRRLLKDARADLHATFAEWLEARVGGAIDQDETIGWHLEQAYLHRHELGPLDERARSLGSRAAERLGAEGRRALARDDLTVAANLIGRAVRVLDTAEPQRSELLLDWCEAVLASGDVGAARSPIDDLDRSANDDRLRAWHMSFVGHLVVLTDPQRLRETAEAVTVAADTLASLGDAAGEAKAHSVRALALARLGEVGACEAALDKALVAARRADDRRRSNAVLAGAPVAALWGPSPVTRASGRCLDVVRVLRITAAAPAVEAVAMRCQAVLEALRGRGEAARRMIAASRRTVEDLGLTTRILEADMAAGLIELVNDDPSAAERILRPTYHGFRDRGLGVDAAQAGALLGRALLALGRISEAEAISHECEAMAGDDLKAAIAWRGVRAEALARRGEYARAIEFAREAVAVATNTDALLDHADARVALAVALRVAGHHTEADAEMAAAFELWSAKGATVLLGGPDGSEADPTRPAPSASSSNVRPNRATAHADRMDAAIEAADLDAIAASLASDLANRYHPLQTTGGRDEVIDSWRMTFAGSRLAVEREDIATIGDNLALCRSRLVIEAREESVEHVGSAVLDQLVVIEVDHDGRMCLGEVFDSDELERATARLHELHAESASAGNLAFAALLTSERRWREGDWDGVLALYDHDEYVLDDRRSMMHVRSSGEEFVDNLRFLFDHGAFTSKFEAGRGDRLALVRAAFTSNRKDAFSTEHCAVAETDADGRLVRMVLFDIDHIDHAYAELEARHRREVSRSDVETNAATRMLDHFAAAMAARDLDAVAALVAPEFRSISRRRLLQSESNRDEYLEFMRMVAVMESAETTGELLATRGDRLAITRLSFRGQDRSVGASEVDYIDVVEVDAEGRRQYEVIFDLEDLDAAYEELDRLYAEGEGSAGAGEASGGLTRMPSNAASRAADGTFAYFDAHDWSALEASAHAAFTYRDHRNGMHTEFDTQQWIESMRLMVGSSAQHQRQQLSVLGDRLALEWVRWTGRSTDPDAKGAEFEVDLLRVVEVDSEGLLTSVSTYDVADRRAANDELWRVFEQSEEGRRIPASIFRHQRAFNSRDLGALRGTLRNDFVFDDRRRTGSGAIGADAYVESVAALLGETDDLVGEVLYWVATNRRGTLSVGHIFGTRRQGGDFESLRVRLIMTDGDVITHVEMFELDDLDVAQSRFEELTATSLAPMNAAVRWFERLDAIGAAENWEALQDSTSPDMEFIDRRPMSHVTLRRDEWVESCKLIGRSTAIQQITVLSALGERLALTHSHFFGDSEGAVFEVDILNVVEVDEGGRMTSVEVFDPADRATAFDELWTRFEQSDERPPELAVLGAARRAFNNHDLAALGALFHEDFAFEDYRRTSIGVLNAHDYLRSVDVLIDESQEFSNETAYTIAQEPWGAVDMTNIVGRTEDGALFENRFSRVALVEDGQIASIAIFEPEEVHRAVARLEQSRPGVVRPHLNTCSQTLQRFDAAHAARDFGALRSCLHPAMIFDERQAMTAVVSRSEVVVEMLRHVADAGARLQRTALSTLGDGLALHRVHWKAPALQAEEGPGAFELDSLLVSEVDEDGLVTATVSFDLDDRVAANDEMWRRFRNSDEGRVLPPVVFDAVHAMNHRDAEAFRRALADDADLIDHRPLGIDWMGPDQYAEPLGSLIAETSESVYESLYTVRITSAGAVGVARISGHTLEGASFELDFAHLTVARNGRLALTELYPPDDLDLAVTRFDELQRDAVFEPSNGATRALDRAHELFEARDWDAFEALASPHLVFEDRRSQVLVDADRDGWLRSSKLMASAGAKERRTVLSALADHLALYSSVWHAEVDGALVEVETLGLAEVDADGRFVTLGHYDLDDHRHAIADLWNRLRASEPHNRAIAVAGDVAAAANRRDLEAVRALLSEGCTVFDHRSLANEPMNRDQYIAYLAALVDETSDFLYETIELIRVEHDGIVDRARLVGHSHDGGAFEKVGLRATVVRDGLLIAMDTFPLDAEEAALARFDELRRADPGRIPATSATRAMDRWEAALVAGDRRAIEDLTAESLVFDDRRALNRTTGDLTAWRRTTEATLASNVRLERLVLSTLGDRLELERQHWAGEVDGAVIDGESLTIREVDAGGHLTAVVIFDADDRVAANDELRERFRLSEEGAVLPGVIFDAARAVHHRDVAGIRATLADDFEYVDHRPLGVGRIDADAYVEFFESLLSETSDSVRETLHALRISPAGAVEMARYEGHTLDGAVYEMVWTQVTVVRGGRLAVIENYSPDDVDAALARFEELTGDGV